MFSASDYNSTRSLSQAKAWILISIFIIGNLLLPQLCHLLPQGGLIFLPIYMFTFIGALLCGWQVGIIVALVSPLLNSAIFGMPAANMMPIIAFKGSILVAGVYLGSKLFKDINWRTILFAIFFYQLIGCVFECILYGNISQGFQDLQLGIPGILIQLIIGLSLAKYIQRKNS